jgi:spore germination protein GerM
VSRKISNNLGSDFTKNVSQRSRRRVKPGVIAFWAGFALIMGVLFLVNRERINNTIRNAPFPAWFSSGKGETSRVSDAAPPPAGETVSDAAPASKVSDTALPDETLDDVDDGDNGLAAPDSDAAAASSKVSDTTAALGGSVEKVSDTTAAPGATAIPSALGGAAATGVSASGATGGAAATGAATQNRPLYFIQVDREGTILRSPVVRPIAVSGSPLQDALRTLIQGPTVEEIGRGLISLIPEGTRLLSVTIRGQTAFINLSEEFRFNHYGIEGYVAQVNQIVWTATEFSTVNDAQLLIDGQRVDWLVEGLWIGSPLKR